MLVYGIFRLTGQQVTEPLALLLVGIEAYFTVAMSLAAAWLADREHSLGDVFDSLWPRCRQCGYSLRGLPLPEAWLARQSKEPPAVQAAGIPSQGCPECGLDVAESLHECEPHLARRRALPGMSAELLQLQALPDGALASRPGRLAAWMLNTRRLTAVTLWLISAVIPASALLLPALQWGMPLSSYLHLPVPGYFCWLEILLWTGLVGLVVGMRFSLRVGCNALYVGQHALVPAVVVGGSIFVALRVAYPSIWSYVLAGLNSVQSLCLVLTVLVLVMELLVLSKVERLVLRKVPGRAAQA
jgi:hypothetical protein